MKVLFLTNEYPPHIYGGAGVHVGYLSRELAKTMPVEVRCFGNQRLEEGNLKVIGFELDTSNFTCPKPLRSAFGAVRRCTDFNTMNIDPTSCIVTRGIATLAGSWPKRITVYRS